MRVVRVATSHTAATPIHSAAAIWTAASGVAAMCASVGLEWRAVKLYWPVTRSSRMCSFRPALLLSAHFSRKHSTLVQVLPWRFTQLEEQQQEQRQYDGVSSSCSDSNTQ